jgi:hypothetical protein
MVRVTMPIFPQINYTHNFRPFVRPAFRKDRRTLCPKSGTLNMSMYYAIIYLHICQ